MTDRKVRRAVTRESHYWFFNVYFHEYVTHETAPFQRELFALTEDEANKILAIVAFRGSGKTTIMTLSYPLWAILGVQQKKHILILTQTMKQAKPLLRNIRNELEANTILRNDLGPFREDDEWNSYSLVITRYKARLTVASNERSIRGIKHGPHRPDLVILDDVEDLQSIKTRESRNKTYDWVTGDVMPIGSQKTKFIFIGNLLHEDSLLMRLKEQIKQKSIEGIYREYPLLNDKQKIIWPGKYSTMREVKSEKKKIGSEAAWQREYMLRIISGEERVVHPEWIHKYDVLPDNKSCRIIATAIDPAISEKDTADYTAMVSARLCGYAEDSLIYILPNPINERLDFPAARKRAKQLSLALGEGKPTMFYVEDVAFQRALPQGLKEDGIPAEAVPISGQDKRARLVLTTHLIQSGRILFPQKGAEQLIQQLIGFGSEKHDDLVDAFTLLILKFMKEINRPKPEVVWL